MLNFIDLKRRWEYLGLSDLDIVKTTQSLIARIFFVFVLLCPQCTWLYK